MKQLLLFVCLSIFTFGLNAQVFVDADAAGTGDGSSWANAYTNLNDALLAAPAGSSVWIAEGTYTTPDSVSFFIDKELTVLGGFFGTETAASAANPALYPTILSGDVAGNDVVGAYDSTGYVDNNRVLFIVDTNEVSAFTVTLDGLTIANGGIAENRPTGGSVFDYAGAGILSLAKLNASRLKFVGNRSTLGSALALILTTANESVLDSITVSGNFSSDNRQVYLNTVDNAVIKNSTFIGDGDTQQTSGFIQAAFTNGFVVENSTFTDMTSAFSGGGIRLDNSDDAIIRNCSFDNMVASTGGAIYLIQANDFVPDSEETDVTDFIIDGCTITNCFTATGRGGAFTSANTNFTLSNSTLSDNASGAIGGAIYHQLADARSYQSSYVNTVFDGNTDQGAGGAICVLIFGTADLEGTVEGSTFNENVSGGQGSGAAMYLQSENNFTISNTMFTKNEAGFGTVLTRGVTGLELNNVTFAENGSTTNAFQGAGVVGYFDDNSAGLTIDSSTFSDNVVTDFGTITSGGAAIYSIGGTSKSIPMIIKNTQFLANGANEGRSGGALYLIGGFATSIEGCDFIDNNAGGDAGAINIAVGEATRDTVDEEIILTFEPFSGSVKDTRFINSTSGNQGGAISTQRAGLDFTNCVFANNAVAGDGSGGAIIFNGNAPGIDGDGNIVEIGAVNIDATFVNNTFVDNFKGEADFAVGDHIAIFQPGDTNDPDSNSMKLVLTNNAFLLTTGAPAIEVELGASEPAGFVPVGNVFFESLGGNLFNGENGPEVDLGDAGDIFDENITDVESLFIDITNEEDEGYNANLAILGDQGADNPLINNGVINALTPVTDIVGNPRGNAPDIGAYEADQGAVSTDQPVEDSGLALTFYPNPTHDVVNIQNDDPTITKINVVVSDQAGRILKAARFTGSNNRLDLSAMPVGIYNLQLYVNGKVYSKQIVKQ